MYVGRKWLEFSKIDGRVADLHPKFRSICSSESGSPWLLESQCCKFTHPLHANERPECLSPSYRSKVVVPSYGGLEAGVQEAVADVINVNLDIAGLVKDSVGK